MYRSVVLWVLLCSNVLAHEMTPTYPKWSVSAIEGVKKTTMTMFNSRKDVQFYEIGVFDESWKPIPFVTSYRILKVDYLSVVNFDVYIREQNIKDTEYICSLSKLRENGTNLTMMATKICSRFK
jgi:hypothetical protein